MSRRGLRRGLWLRADSSTPPAQAGSLVAAAGKGAGFLHGLFACFIGFAGSLLNPADKFFLLAFVELQIVIREPGPFLFQLAFGDASIAFDFEFGHCGSSCLFSFTVRGTAELLLQRSCWLRGSIQHQPSGGVAAQRFGIRAVFVRLLDNALSLEAINSRELRV